MCQPQQVERLPSTLAQKSLNFSFSRGLIYQKSLKFTYWAPTTTSNKPQLKETTGREFRVYRASIRYLDPL